MLRPACAKMCVNQCPKAKIFGGTMRNQFSKSVVGCVLAVVCSTLIVSAQAPAPGTQATPAVPVYVVANPTYVSISMEITVNRSAAEVWKRVGKYCDIGEWLQVTCTIIS